MTAATDRRAPTLGEPDTLVVHASELVTARTDPGGAVGDDLGRLEVVEDGAVAIAGGRIVDVGATRELAARHPRVGEVVDAGGRLVTPGFVGCHVHLVHGGSRHAEYDRKIRGLAQPVGARTGIAATVAHTAAASDQELRERARADLDTMLAHGTTTTEAKTGYGGGADGELRLLELTAALDHPVTVAPRSWAPTRCRRSAPTTATRSSTR